MAAAGSRNMRKATEYEKRSFRFFPVPGKI